MWSLAGVRPVFGAALTDPVSPPLPESRQLLVDGLNCLDSDQDVRRAVEELGVRYVYSSNTTITGPATTNRGFLDLAGVASLKPVYDRDGAVVYEIDLTPLADTPDDDQCGWADPALGPVTPVGTVRPPGGDACAARRGAAGRTPESSTAGTTWARTWHQPAPRRRVPQESSACL